MDKRTVYQTPNWIKSDALSDFIDELKEAGYKIGVSEYISAQRLILALITKGEILDNPARLSTMLGPIFCSSPAEQDDFQQRFNCWIESLRPIPQLDNDSNQFIEKSTVDKKSQELSKELGNIRTRTYFAKRIIYFLLLTASIAFLLTADSKKENTIPKQIESSSPSPKTVPSLSDQTPSPTLPSETPISEESISPVKPVHRALSHFFLGWQMILIISLLALYIALTFFMIWRLWWFQHSQRFLQRLSTCQEPDLLKISIQEFEKELFPNIIFVQISRALKHRIRVPSHIIDIYKTIDLTLKKGGWLSPVFGTSQSSLEYLFLIDCASFQDHQARYFLEIIDRLKRNEVLITVFLFDGDPRICFHEGEALFPKKLHEIFNQYYQCCLIILSDTDHFFNSINGKFMPWVSQLKSWERRAFLTPKPLGNWSNQELTLAQHFILLPATFEGLTVLGQVLNPERTKPYVLSGQFQNPLPDLLLTKPYRWIESDPPTPEKVDAILPLINEYLGNEGYYWLCASAIFPVLNWNITIYLGWQLKTEKGQSLIEVCSIVSLARLPWFRSGYLPDWLRVRLILSLTSKQESTIRSALQSLLISSVQGTVTKQQLEVATNFQNLLPELINPMLRILAKRASEDSPLRDHLFLSFMQGKPILATTVPDELRHLIKRKPLIQLLSQKNLQTLAIGAMATIGTTVLILYLLQQGQRNRITALIAKAELSFSQTPQQSVINLITATGLSRSTFVQFPDYPSFPSLEHSFLKLLQQSWKTIVIHQQSNVRSVAFSPDDQRIVSGSSDGTMRLLNSETGAVITSMRGHNAAVNSVAFSPNGQIIVSGSGDNTLRMWDVETGKPIGEPLKGHQSTIYSVAFSPNGQIIVSGSGDNTLRMWDVETGKPIGEPLKGHQSTIYSVAFSPDGQRIVSGSGDNTLRMWDAKTGKPIGEPLKGHQSTIYSVGFSPDGQRIVSGSGDNTLRMWDAKTGQLLGEPLQGHQSTIYSVGFSPDGQRIVSGSGDNTLRMWDAKTGQLLGEPLQGHQATIYSVTFSLDGQRIVSGSGDNTVRLWNPQRTKASISMIWRGHDAEVSSVAYSPDGRHLATSGDDGSVRLWDTTGKQLAALKSSQGRVLSVAYSPDGRQLATSGDDGSVRLWDTTGKQLAILKGHQGRVLSVAYSPDGRQLVTSGDDGSVRLWDTTGTQLAILKGHQGQGPIRGIQS